MQTLTCPIPTNLNPLSPNGFQFGITKIPEVSFFCQEVSIPEVSLPMATQSTPLSDSRVPGDKLEFGELTIQFLIDEDMGNYLALHNWIMGLGFPKDHNQYTKWLRDHALLETSELQQGYSDGNLIILNSNNAPNKTIKFVDLFPTSLASLQFQSTISEINYLVGTASFGYTYYEFE